MKRDRRRGPAPVLLLALGALLPVVGLSDTGAADGELPLSQIIEQVMAARGASIQLAPDHQLCRRYALDLTGVVPTAADLEACAGRTPGEMFDLFRAKGPMGHTDGETPFVWINLLHDADHFLFSNSTQFSQVAHIREFRGELRRVYAEGRSYADFARWALESQMFLNRFPSGADRANAAFFLYLGRDSLSIEVPVGNMWNGWGLRNDDIPASQAETNGDYHVYDWDPSRCDSREVLCEARLWDVRGDRPQVAIDAMVGSTVFAEATVSRYWERYVGRPLPAVNYPDILRTLAVSFVERGYDVPWLIREITTSPAYTQEMMYR